MKSNLHTYTYKSTITAIMMLLLISLMNSKSTHRQFPASDIAQGSQTVFVSKFGVSTAGGTATLKYRIQGDSFAQAHTFKMGVLSDQNFYLHKAAQSCQEKQQFYISTHALSSMGVNQGIVITQLSKNHQEHLYFFYFYTCDYMFIEQGNQSTFIVDMMLQNNGIGMQQYSLLIWPYLLMIVSFLILVTKYSPVILPHLKKGNILGVLLSIVFIVIGAVVLVRFLDVAIKVVTGRDQEFFYGLYIAFKAMQEVLMVTVLTCIAWGWLLSNVDNKKYYVGIVLAVTVLNMLSEVLAAQNKQQISDQNLYQGFVGKLILILKIIITLTFVSGCLYISLHSSQKRQSFINSFAQLGTAYLLTNLISLIFSEMFAHSYNHGETVPMLEDLLRFVGIICLCYMFALPKHEIERSRYQEVGFGFDDDNSSCIQKQEFNFHQQNHSQGSGYVGYFSPIKSKNSDIHLINFDSPKQDKSKSQSINSTNHSINKQSLLTGYQNQGNIHLKINPNSNNNNQKNKNQQPNIGLNLDLDMNQNILIEQKTINAINNQSIMDSNGPIDMDINININADNDNEHKQSNLI